MLTQIPYDREKALQYAKNWAFGRNPSYYDYSTIGGDCTSFASQCLYAGCGVMNYTPTHGWYYASANDKSPSWTGVPYFYQFLTQNEGVGPYAEETGAEMIEPGDFIQLQNENGEFYHTLTVTEAGSPAESILVASHSIDAFGRALGSYTYAAARCLHVLGARKYTGPA